MRKYRNIKYLSLYYVITQVPAAIAAWLGCLRLSDVMRAVLMPSFVMTELQELPGISLQEVGICSLSHGKTLIK